MDTKDLEILLTVADYGSITRAAEKFGVRSSSLSRRISDLEDELGAAIFERDHSGTRPTFAGSQVIAHARRALTSIAALRASACEASLAREGNVRLGTHMSTIGWKLRALLKRWREQHAMVDVTLLEGNDTELLGNLKRRLIDAAVLIGPLADEGFNSKQLWTERLRLAVPEDHRLSRREAVSWQDVRGDRVLVRSWVGGHVFRELQVDRLGAGAHFIEMPVGMANILNGVSIGLGVALVVDFHRELAIPGLKFLDIAEEDAVISIELAWVRELEHPVVGNFIAFLRDNANAVT